VLQYGGRFQLDDPHVYSEDATYFVSAVLSDEGRTIPLTGQDVVVGDAAFQLQDRALRVVHRSTVSNAGLVSIVDGNPAGLASDFHGSLVLGGTTITCGGPAVAGYSCNITGSAGSLVLGISGPAPASTPTRPCAAGWSADGSSVRP